MGETWGDLVRKRPGNPSPIARDETLWDEKSKNSPDRI